LNYVLITISGGIIGQVVFYDLAIEAVRALVKYVKTMNPEKDDAAVYEKEGLIINAKVFLDECDQCVKREIKDISVSSKNDKPIYIIGNPRHILGFMVTSEDDPLGYVDPVGALSDLGQMRKDHGNHLNLYRVVPVKGPLTERSHLEKYNADCGVEDFEYSLVREYLNDADEKGGFKVTRTVEIYFRDLTPDAQEHLLKEFRTNEEDENWDSIPIAVTEREIEDPYP